MKINWWTVSLVVFFTVCALAGLFNVYWQVYYARPNHHPNIDHYTANSDCIHCIEEMWVTKKDEIKIYKDFRFRKVKNERGL